MNWLDPKQVVRRLYTAVAVLAFLPVLLVVLADVLGRVLAPLLPLIVVGTVLIMAFRFVLGRRR